MFRANGRCSNVPLTPVQLVKVALDLRLDDVERVVLLAVQVQANLGRYGLAYVAVRVALFHPLELCQQILG